MPRSFRLSLIAISLIATFSTSNANAHREHTPDVCSLTSSSVCAHLGFETKPNSTDAWSFMLHFVPAAGIDPKLITNVTVKLWMNMGSHSHGSSPVTIATVGDAHFQVTDAYFPMSGLWEVKVGFSFENATHEIVIPVMVGN